MSTADASGDPHRGSSTQLLGAGRPGRRLAHGGRADACSSLWLVWLPAIGVGPAVLHQLGRDRPVSATIKSVGLKNYSDVVTIYPPFWPACSTT